jgi:hypothetical protein
LRVRWADKISNEKLHRRPRATKTSETIKGRTWKGIGLRMDSTRMHHRTGMATRGKRESWKTKDNMEKDYRARKNRARMEHLGVCQGSGKRQKQVEAVCRGLMCQWARRG